jgi:hypothetical protein
MESYNVTFCGWLLSLSMTTQLKAGAAESLHQSDSVESVVWMQGGGRGRQAKERHEAASQ